MRGEITQRTDMNICITTVMPVVGTGRGRLYRVRPAMPDLISIHQVQKETWKDRLGRVLFPHTYLAPWPEEGEDGHEPGWSAGDLTLEIFIYLDWKDRLRLLFSGKLSLRSRTKTDAPVDRAKTKSTCHVLPPWWRRRDA